MILMREVILKNLQMIIKHMMLMLKVRKSVLDQKDTQTSLNIRTKRETKIYRQTQER